MEALPDLPVGGITVRQWRANDLYDPDYAAGGHQPYGFDQIMSQYLHFTVIHSRLDVELMATIEYRAAHYNIILSDAAGEAAAAFAAGGYGALSEMPRRSQGISAAIDGPHASVRTISYQFDACKQFHKDIPSLCGNTPYSGTAAASPTEDAYYEVVGYNPTGLATDFTNSSVRYTLTYWVVFSEPKWFSTS